MVDLVLVSALVAPNSAVGPAARVSLGRWTGVGAALMEKELTDRLWKGAVGAPLASSTQAWPAPTPILVVPGDQGPEVIISGQITVSDPTVLREPDGCGVWSAQTVITAEAVRLEGPTVADRLSWTVVLTERACGAQPILERQLPALISELAPEIAAFVAPNWVHREATLLRTPACARGNDAALEGDWERAAVAWVHASRDAACVYNLGVNAELKGELDHARTLYERAGKRGVTGWEDAVARTRARSEELEAMGREPAEHHEGEFPSPRKAERRPGLPTPAAARTHRTLPPPEPSRLRISLGYGRVPSRGAVTTLLLTPPEPLGLRPGIYLRSVDGVDRGLTLGAELSSPTGPGLKVGILPLPGAPVDPFTAAQPGEYTKPDLIWWGGLLSPPLTLSAPGGLGMTARASLGLGQMQLGAYDLSEGRSPDVTDVVKLESWPQGVAAAGLSLELQLNARLALRSESSLLYWYDPAEAAPRALLVRSLGLTAGW